MRRDPHRALVAAVLIRAIRDAHGSVPTGHRRSAVAFLRLGNVELEGFCDLIDLDPSAFLLAVDTNGTAWCRSRRSA